MPACFVRNHSLRHRITDTRQCLCLFPVFLMSCLCALLLHPRCLFPALQRCCSTDIMKPCLAIYMQSRDKEQDIHWNHSQFTGRDLIGGYWLWVCNIILQGRKKNNQGVHKHSHAQLRHLDKDRRPWKSFLMGLEGKAEVFSSEPSRGSAILPMSPAD